MTIVNRPSRGAVAAAHDWARKQIRRYPDYSDHVRALRDELAWQTERREHTLAALANFEAQHASVVPIATVRQLLTEGDR